MGGAHRMTGAWMWARAELRARWRSWVVLGLLAGVTAGVQTFRARLRVVGITKSVSSDESWSPSSGLWARHGDDVVGVTNMFVRLRHGATDFERFRRDVQGITGHPVNVERGADLLGIP